MKKIINRRIYDTETSEQLAFKYVGEFGEANGYEERLYLTNRGLYFIYGVGGPDSPYPQETIKPIEKEQAEAWETELPKEKDAEQEVIAEKPGKAKKPAKKAKEKDTKAKKSRKPPVKKAAKTAEAVSEAETAGAAEGEKA